jgi:hypothetical protein
LTFARDIDTIESDQQRIKEYDLIKQRQEEARPYIDFINSGFEYYELDLRVQQKRKKRPKFEEHL